MLQLRPKATAGAAITQVSYAPARDIVWLFPNAIQRSLDIAMQAPPFPLRHYLDEHGVTPEMLAATAEKFSQAVVQAADNPDESMVALLTRTGYMNAPAPSQVALMYCIGTVMAATFLHGVRDVRTLGDDPPPEIKRLASRSEALQQYLQSGRLMRWWLRLRERLWSSDRQFTLGGR